MSLNPLDLTVIDSHAENIYEAIVVLSVITSYSIHYTKLYDASSVM